MLRYISCRSPACTLVVDNCNNTGADAAINMNTSTLFKSRVFMADSPSRLPFHDCYSRSFGSSSLCNLAAVFCQPLTVLLHLPSAIVMTLTADKTG
jgi:hypothetical protein